MTCLNFTGTGSRLYVAFVMTWYLAFATSGRTAKAVRPVISNIMIKPNNSIIIGTRVLHDLKRQNTRPIFWKFESKSAKMHFQRLHCQSTRNMKKPLQNQCLSFQIVCPISYLFCRLKNGQDADHCHLLFPSSCPVKNIWISCKWHYGRTPLHAKYFPRVGL